MRCGSRMRGQIGMDALRSVKVRVAERGEKELHEVFNYLQQPTVRDR
jgi:hypothetical protein